MFYRVIGPAGSGKREWLEGFIKTEYEKGKKIVVIVPEQASALYERRVIELCGAGANLSVEVCNFSRLSNIVLRSFGSLSRRALTEGEKKVVLSLVLKEQKEAASRLSLRSDPDSVEALLAEMEEVHLAGLDQAALDEICRTGVVDEALREKLQSLLTLRAAFREKIARRFDDPSDEEERLAHILEEYPFFRDKVVVLDLFWDFTAPQEKILRRIFSQAEHVAVSFVARKKETELFARPLSCAARLLRFAREAGCQVEDVTLLEKETEGELPFLRQNLIRGGVTYPGPCEHISLTAAATPEEEALFVAQTIRRLVAEGARWQDFAILYRSPENQLLFQLTLEREGIPVFTDEAKSVADSPLAKTLLLAARIASGDARESVVRAYLNAGVFLCPEEERFLLEKYVATWSLSGRRLLDGNPFSMNPDGYMPKNEEQEERLRLVNRGKKTVFDPLRSLSMALATGSCAQKISALVAFLVKIGAEKILRQREADDQKAGRYHEAGEVVRMWNCILERLSGLGRVMGESQVAPEEFLSLLTLTLSGSLPGSLPSGQDRVQMGPIGFVRPEEVRHVFVLDFAAGLFPAPAPQGRILTQEERETLFARGYPISFSEREQSQEYFLLYLAASLPRENLFFVWATQSESDEGQSGLSLFGKRLLSLFSQLKIQTFDPKSALPLTDESAFRLFLAAESDSPLQKALLDYFSKKEAWRERVFAALEGKAFAREEMFLREEKPYRDRDISMTYSRLEKYSTCRFSYFAQYLLEARGEKKASLGANITGTFVHAVLEKVLSTLAGEGKTLADTKDDRLAELNHLFCQEVMAENGLEAGDVALQMQLAAVERSTLMVLKNLKKEFSVSHFLPLYFEKGLEELGGAYEIDLPDGKKLCLWGTIDRVDRYVAKNGREYVRVVDYKTGSHDFNLVDVANGLDTQMLLYLFALWNRPVTGGEGVLPAGVLYLNGMEKARVCNSKADLELVESSPYLSLSREGLLVDDEELLSAQDPEGKGEFLPVAWKGRRVTKKGLISLEKMGRLKRKVERDFARLAAEIKEGQIQPNPLYSAAKQIDSCRWCEHLPICKRSPECRRPYRTRISEEELFGKEEA